MGVFKLPSISSADRSSVVLSQRELVFDTDRNAVYYGDGTTSGGISLLTTAITALNLSAGTTSNNLSAFTLSNSNGVSFGLNGSIITASIAGAPIAISGGTSSANLGSIVFSNSNGVSFGLNGSTITASAAGGGGGAALKASGTYTQNTGTVEFANSNGITFGLSNNGTMTASHNGITTGRASTDGIGLNTAQSNVTWTANSAGLSFDARGYAGIGTSATNASITLNSNGLAISVAAPGGGGSLNISAGTTSSNLTNFKLIDSNGVSWSLDTGSKIYATVKTDYQTSGAYLTTAMQSNAATISNINLSGGTTSSNLSAFKLVDSQGISWSLDTGSKVYGTVKTDYIPSVTGVDTGGLGASFKAAPINLMQANGFSFIISSNSISGSYTVPSIAGLVSAINISGGTTSSNLTNFTLVNSNGVSWSLDTNSKVYATVKTDYQTSGAYLTTARGSSDGVGLNTAQSNVTWTVNSSGISFNAIGYAGTGVSITGNASITNDSLGIKFNGSGLAGTGLTFNVTNLLVSSTLNSNGLNISLNNSDDHYKAFSLVGNTAGTNASTNTTIGTFYLSGGNNITLSGNSNTIRIDGAAPGGTTFWTNSYFEWPLGAAYRGGTSSLTMGNSSMYVQPFIIENPISGSYIRHLVSLPAFGSSTQAVSASTVTADWYATFYANIFSQGAGANSKSLQLLYAATAGMTNRWMWSISNAGTNISVVWQMTYPSGGANTANDGLSYSITSANINWSTTGNQSKYTGLRWLDIPFGSSLAPGNYWMQFQRSTSSATTGGNFANTTGLTTNMTLINITQLAMTPGQFGNTIGSADGLQLGLGVYTTNSSGGTTNSMSLGGISMIAGQPVFPFQIIRQA